MRESNAELASFTCWKLVERCDRDDKIRPRAAHDVAECLLKQPYHLHEHGAPIEKPAERKRCEQGSRGVSQDAFRRLLVAHALYWASA